MNADDSGCRCDTLPHVRKFFGSAAGNASPAAFICATTKSFFGASGAETVLLRRGDIGLRGEHNVENVMAAACAAFLVGVSPRRKLPGVRGFAGVEHRIEFVAEIGGVSFYNDSKATNVDATLKALDAFPGGLLVILGGKDKGGDFSLLREPLKKRARGCY